MTLKSLIESHATSVFLNTDHFAESVTHRPLGVTANDATVTAIVEWDEPSVETSHGREVRQSGKLSVADSVSCSVKDHWVVDSVTYQATSVRPAQGGLQIVTIQAHDIEARREMRGGIL